MSLEETKNEQDMEIKLSDISILVDDDVARKLMGQVLDYQNNSFVFSNSC